VDGAARRADGGLELKLTGHAFSTTFNGGAASARRRIVVSGKVQDEASTSAELESGHGLVAASVVSIVGGLPDDPVLYESLHRCTPATAFVRTFPQAR